MDLGNIYEKGSLDYYAILAFNGATEIDNYLLGRNNDFSNIQELSRTLERHQLKYADNFLSFPFFEYEALLNFFRDNSKKDIITHSDFVLEMRLFRAELDSIPKKSKRLEEMRSLLCDLCDKYSVQADEGYGPCFLVA